MNRRFFLRGSVALLAAPAIVRVSSLMPVKAFIPTSSTIQAWQFATANRLPTWKLLYGSKPIAMYAFHEMPSDADLAILRKYTLDRWGALPV